MRDFDGKMVIVTGAARGLGRALCRRFAAAGARIGGLDVMAEDLDATARDLSAEGVEIASAVADLRDEAATFEAIGTLREHLGPIDVLINNAGITHVRTFGAGESSSVRRVMEINFQGAVHATAAAYNDLVARRGQIVVISSVAGFAPLVARAGYCASKHALHGFFDTLRVELRPHGVDVLTVCPSFIATQIRERYPEEGESRRKVGVEDSPETVAESIFRATARGRRLLTTGRVGWASYWVRRFAPRVYEAVMRRTICEDD